MKHKPLNKITDGLGNQWLFLDMWIKKYPYYFGMHRHIDALLELRKEHQFTYDQADMVEAHIAPTDLCADNSDPKTEGEIRFSFQHALGVALLEGEINLPNSSLDAAFDSNYKKARSKVKLILHREYNDKLYMVDPAEVVVTLKDGKKLSRVRQIMKGHPEEPLSAEEFKDLYRIFTRGILPEKQIQRTIELIWNLEELNDIQELMNLLSFGC